MPTDLVASFLIILELEWLKVKNRPDCYANLFTRKLANIIPVLTQATPDGFLSDVLKIVPIQYGHLSMTLIHLFAAVWMLHNCYGNDCWGEDPNMLAENLE